MGMNFAEMLKGSYTPVVVEGVSLRFKRLTWRELEDFQKRALTLDEQGEDGLKASQDFVSYLLAGFVRDDNGDALPETPVADMPFSFCVALIKEFAAFSTGTGDSQADLKKK